MLRISEIMAANTSTLEDETGAFPDWVEVENTGDAAADLTGVTLSDDSAELAKFAFPAGVTLAPGGFLIVFADNDVDDGPLHAAFALSRGGEEVVLAREGQVLSSFAFGPQCPDVSFGIPSGGGTPTFLDTPTPGQGNSGARAAAPSCPEPDVDAGPLPEPAEGVVLNEIAPAGGTSLVDGSGAAEPWVELFNTTANALDLSDHRLTDSPAAPQRWFFPDGTLIGPGGFLLVFLDGDALEGPDHASFVPLVMGGAVLLLGPEGELLSELGFGPSEPGDAWGPAGDDSALLAAPTPGAENAPPATPEDGGSVVDAGHATDAGPTDAGPTDAGPTDAGPTDAGPTDAGPTDAGPTDAGPTDAGADGG